MQMLSNLCLLLLSTFTPAGKARTIAGMTSDSPSIPKESLLPVTWYSRQPRSTGVIRKPAINSIRAIMYQVNSLLITVVKFFFIGGSSLMVR